MSEITSAISEGVQNIKLTYDLITKINNNDEKKESHSIEFSIRVPEDGASCEEISFYDYKPIEEPTRRTKNNRGCEVCT